MKKVPLADVLWDAANKWLATGYDLGARPDPFSCNAIALALTGGTPNDLSGPAKAFVYSLGCNGSARQLSEFCGHENGATELQGVRYLWLLLAMHVAEDEGILVEVAQ